MFDKIGIPLKNEVVMPDRLMVGQHPLEVFIGVRIPVGQLQKSAGFIPAFFVVSPKGLFYESAHQARSA